MGLARVEAAFFRLVEAGRARSALFDHSWRAILRFSGEQAGRLAAAISYYAFFAAFSLSVVVFSVLRRVLNPSDVGFVHAVNDFIANSLPWVTATAQGQAPQQLTAVGGVLLALSGVGWVESLRTSQRAIWGIEQHPGNWFLRRVIDLGLLVALGVLLGLSLAITSAIDWAVERLAPGNGALRVAGPLLALMVNAVLAAAVLGVVARLHLSPRRLLPSVLLVAVGILVLNTVGRAFIDHRVGRPAYQLVTGAVGLLVYLYLLNQLILFAAAFAATSRRGSMVDLAARDRAAGDRAAGDQAASDQAAGDLAARNSGESPGPASQPRDDERREDS